MIVTYVYKNDETMSIFPGDTINYLSKGGAIVKPSEEHPFDGEVIRTPYPVDHDTGERGSVFMMEDEYQSILFMKKSDFPENPDISKRNKHLKASMLQDIKRASIKIGGRRIFRGPIWGLNGLHFDNRYELYKYMEQFEGVNVPLSDPGKMHWDLFGDDDAFNQYLKERNLRDPRDPQVRDSVRRSIEMKFQKAKENKEKTGNRSYQKPLNLMIY